jgi:hypothetical protein
VRRERRPVHLNNPSKIRQKYSFAPSSLDDFLSQLARITAVLQIAHQSPAFIGDEGRANSRVE